MIEVNAVIIKENDYEVHLVRPDGSSVWVLISREDTASFANRCVSEDSETAYGLNLVGIPGDHYS